MEQYYPEDNGEELTFGKVGRFLKKGWLRMVVYALIALAVAAIIVVPIKVYYKTEQVATTSIEFVYKGIEKGEDPNGGTFDRDVIISTRVLTAAVEEAQLTEKITEISKLRSAMRVDGVPSEEYYKLVEAAAQGDADAQAELRQLIFYPTRFDIVLSRPSELGLTDDEAILLLERVVSCYYEDFAERYTLTNVFSPDIYTLTDSAHPVEFADMYDVYVNALAPVSDYINTLNKKAPSFISTENDSTFSLLISEYSTLSLNYEMFNNFILVNNVWKNKATAADALDGAEKKLQNEVTTLNAYVDALKLQVNSIKPQESTVITAVGTTTVTTYPDQYYEYQDKLNEAQLRVKTLSDQLYNVTMRKDKIGDPAVPTDEALIAEANAELKKIERESAAFINKVNATVADYYASTVVSGAVRQVQPAMVTRKNAGLNIVVILIIAFAVGLIVGGIVTGVKMSNAKVKKSRPVSEPEYKAGKDKE